MKGASNIMKTQPNSRNDCLNPDAAASLHDRVRDVLDRNGYKGSMLLDELMGSYEFNNQKILEKIRNYKIAGTFLLYAIPVISMLTATLNKESLFSGSISPLLILLSLFTLFYSILKPAERFQRCCQVGISFFHWRCELLEGLDELPVPATAAGETKLKIHLTRMQKKLKSLQASDIKLYLPDQPPAAAD